MVIFQLLHRNWNIWGAVKEIYIAKARRFRQRVCICNFGDVKYMSLGIITLSSQ